jgi:hypothetical protein
LKKEIKKRNKAMRYFYRGWQAGKSYRGDDAGLKYMNMKFIDAWDEINEYEHHGNLVKVREDLKGLHREYCLCWRCAKFFPENREENCIIADMIYTLCVIEKLVLPVWECPEFELM